MIYQCKVGDSVFYVTPYNKICTGIIKKRFNEGYAVIITNEGVLLHIALSNLYDTFTDAKYGAINKLTKEIANLKKQVLQIELLK